MLGFFKSTRAANAERKANRGYYFLVLNGQGVTIYDLDKNTQEIQLHNPHKIDREDWFRQEQTVFPGLIEQPSGPLRIYDPWAGQDMVLHNLGNDTWSQVLRTDAVFNIRHITEKVRPHIFWTYLIEEGLLPNLQQFTSVWEAEAHTKLIRALFFLAVSGNSWSINYSEVFTQSGYYVQEILDDLLMSLAEVGLITFSEDKVTLQGSLVFLMMHAINRRLSMRGPIFTNDTLFLMYENR